MFVKKIELIYKMELRKKLLPLLLAPALFFENLTKSKAGDKFSFWYVPFTGEVKKVACIYKTATTTNQHINKTLYKQKQEKQEFKPPELPYCRVVRADWQGVVIDYYPEDYNETKKAYTLRWAVNNINWYTIGGANVELLYTAGYNVELGSYDKAFIQDCLIRASRKVLANSGTTAGSYSLVRIKRARLYVSGCVSYNPSFINLKSSVIIIHGKT
jgi:hypothetical protein